MLRALNFRRQYATNVFLGFADQKRIRDDAGRMEHAANRAVFRANLIQRRLQREKIRHVALFIQILRITTIRLR